MIQSTLRLLLLLLLILPSTGAARQPSLAAFLPGGAAGFAEVSNLSEIIHAVRHSRNLEWITGTDEYRQYEKSPDFRKVTAFRATAELMLGASLWDASADLLTGRIAVAFYPDPDNPMVPQAVAIARFDESKTLGRLREALNSLLTASGSEIDTSAVLPGSASWRIQDQFFITLHAEWLVAARQRPLLDRTLALLAGAKDAPAALAADAGFAAMEQAVGVDHHARAWVDAALVKRVAGPRFGLPAKFQDGMASLIFGGLVELADHSPFAAAALDVHASDLEGMLVVAGDPAKLAEPAGLWFTRFPDNGVIDLPKTPGTIAGVTLHRKLGQWYRLRNQLLDDRLLPAFDKFETDIGNLLPQKDFGEDVLPLIGDNFTLTAALQRYDHLDGEPGIKLPAFAAVFDMPDPAAGADTFALFFQTLSAILNLQAGQEGRQPSVLDSEFYRETKITFSRFLDKPKGDRLPIAYNFQPAAAGVGRKYIVATSLQYCRDLIDHFKNPEAVQWQNRNAEMVIDAGALTKLGELNEGLLRSQEIQKGQSPEAAGKRISLLLAALGQLDSLRYHSSSEGGMFRMHLKTSWK